MSDTTPQTSTAVKSRDKPKPKTPRAWNVVLLDDDDHSYDYVIRMMQELFGATIERGYLVACKVDVDGRAVCLTTHLEHAELKRDQIHAYGRDPLMARSKGSMSAVLEPADFEGDGDDERGGGKGDGGEAAR